MSSDPVLRRIDATLAAYAFEGAVDRLFAHGLDDWKPGELDRVLGWEVPREFEYAFLREPLPNFTAWHGDPTELEPYRDHDAQAEAYLARYRRHAREADALARARRGYATTYAIVDEVYEWPADVVDAIVDVSSEVGERIVELGRDLARVFSAGVDDVIRAITNALKTEPPAILGGLEQGLAALTAPRRITRPRTPAALRIAEDQRRARARRAPLPPAPFVARHLPRPRGHL